MLRMRFLGWMFPIVVLLPASEMASGQSFPTKVIGIVVGGIGGSLDITARLIAQGVAAPLGQPVIVENRASVTIAADVVAKAPADGYTLLMTGSNLWILPLLESKPSFDPVGDFSAVTLATRSPSVLVIHPSLPVKSVKELIALAKARPGELNYASGSSGSASHLAAELFRARAGVNIMRINYKSAAAGLVDLAGGQVQVMFPVAASVAPYMKSGRVKALYKVVSQHRVIAIVDVDSVEDLDRNSMGWLPMREYLEFEHVWALRDYEGFIKDVQANFLKPKA